MAKNGLPAVLSCTKFRERRGALRLAAKGIRNQFPKVSMSERRKRDPLDLSAGVLDRLELARQRMRGVDLVVAIGADQHQMPQLRPGQQILQQVERRRVEPLQIVEEEGKRMVRSGKDADESAEHELETTLRLLRLEAPGPAAGHR